MQKKVWPRPAFNKPSQAALVVGHYITLFGHGCSQEDGRSANGAMQQVRRHKMFS